MRPYKKPKLNDPLDTSEDVSLDMTSRSINQPTSDTESNITQSDKVTLLHEEPLLGELTKASKTSNDGEAATKISETEVQTVRKHTAQSQNTHPFINLSTDLHLIILSLVTTPDLLQLSLTNHQFRKFLLPHIFYNVNIQWSQISQEFKYCHLVRLLRITDCNSYGEWHVDVFSLLDRFPNLSHFLINSSNSSNWLKYRGLASLKELTLYFDKSQTSVIRAGSLVRGSEITPRRIGIGERAQQTLTMSTAKNEDPGIPGSSVHVGSHLTGNNPGSPRIFNLGHVHNFQLTSLTLYNYHFNWEPQDHIPSKLENLTIHDCTWEYPFKLSQFNKGHDLKGLKLCYSTNNSFILSERFNKFLTADNEDDKDDFESLESLSIVFLARPSSWEKPLSLRQLKVFVSPIYPNLAALKLHGWSMNAYSLPLILKGLDLGNHNLRLLDLDVIDNSKEGHPQVIEPLKKYVKGICPWMKLNLNIRTVH